MRILIDIGHPAHVHYFKYFIQRMENNGHSFLVTARDKDVSQELLKSYNIAYKNRGKGGKDLFGKFVYLFKADLFLFNQAVNYNPDIFLSFSSPYAAHVSRLLRKPHIAFTDTEHAKLGNLAFVPFSDVVFTPSCITKNFGKKQIRFYSYMEMCYLHPDYFTPDPSIFRLLGIEKNRKYVIIRFVSWEASHDVGHSGISIENKINAVKAFSKIAKVFISSEGKLPSQLEKYRINIPSKKMHDALNFATLLYGESSTMASESAMLGTPAIFIDNDGRGYTDEQEQNYNLVYNFTESKIDQERSIQKGIELLSIDGIKKEWKKRRQKMLADKIDVTAFMIWFIKNYPQSFDEMKRNPNYQYKFK